jgi:hypothetical protein
MVLPGCAFPRPRIGTWGTLVRADRSEVEKQQQILRPAYPTAWGPRRASSQDDTVVGDGAKWTTGRLRESCAFRSLRIETPTHRRRLSVATPRRGAPRFVVIERVEKTTAETGDNGRGEGGRAVCLLTPAKGDADAGLRDAMGAGRFFASSGDGCPFVGSEADDRCAA